MNGVERQMFHDLAAATFVTISRLLPNPLSYRLEFALRTRLVHGDMVFDKPVPFGNSRIQSTFEDHNDRRFALHWTNSLVGLSLATVAVRPGDVVYELGSNVGTETLALAGLVGQTGTVVALEPSPHCSSVLDRRLTSNGITNVRLLRVAVSAAAGWIGFEEGNSSNTGTGHARNWSEGEVERGVEAIAMDDLLAYGRPSFIFIDIEGAECRALEGAGRIMADVRPVIFSELHSFALERAGNSVSEFCARAREHRYRIFDANSTLKRELVIQDDQEIVFTDVILVPEERLGLIKAVRRRVLLYTLFPWLLSHTWNRVRRWRP